MLPHHIFEEIIITPLSLERIRLIAQHELIATCVKSVTFYADLLPSILPEMWHERLISETQMRTMEEASFRYQRYVLAYCEQQRLCKNNHKLNREIIDLSIPMLRRLQRLKLTTGGHSLHVHQVDNSSRPNQQWSKVWFDLRRHALDEQVSSRRETEIARQFTHLLNALASSEVYIRKLSLTTFCTSVWQRGIQLSPEPYCAGLRRLNTICLDTPVFFRHLHSTVDRQGEVKALGMLLEGAQSLQTLKLHGNAVHPKNDFLQSRLSLLGITATEKHLIDTLLAYRATLARLDLVMVSLDDSKTGQSIGSWHQFLRRVPESLPHLRDIRLRSLYHRVRGPRARGSQGRLEPLYLKAVEHAINNGTNIPQPMRHSTATS